VVRTLLVGDEPRDIVFAGPSNGRAFITTAHRGQNTPLHATIDTELQTASIGRADVWVFDAANLGATLGGTPLTRITLFGDTPRGLAASPDGSTVYAAVFQSGNQTTTINQGFVPDGCQAAGGLPAPCTDHLGVPQPETGLIVKFDGVKWTDELNRNWSPIVRFNLPDEDVLVIDADASPPVQLAGAAGSYAHVGTTLFNMAVNPVSGKVYVSNTEAFNEVRFEGPGDFAGSTVRGHLAESRISVLGSAGAVTPIHLNKHIDYDDCCDPIPNAVNDRSLAFPLEMAVTNDGETLYVSAFGSGAIGIFDTAELEANTFTPSAGNRIAVSGGGPTGLVLDEARSRLYTLTRFDNSISILSTTSGMETAHIPLHNPEPDVVVEGRRFLYDAKLTSSHGDQACASCHIFGDFDSLAWDLGNPDDTTINNPGPIIPPFGNENVFGTPDFRALKGPMTTQSLRGMDNHGPMHWRGDRTGGNDVVFQTQPDGGAFSERSAFTKFNPAFEGLIGRSEPLTDDEMQAFTSFVLEVMYPPNPIRNLDSSMTPMQIAGRNFFFGPVSDTRFNCNGCHTTDPLGNARFASVKRPGFFGGDGRYTFEGGTQFFKVPQLRNMYQKIGMFGFLAPPGGGTAPTGDQVRGYGFAHDGSVDTLFRFVSGGAFNQSGANPGGFPVGAPGDPLRHSVQAFMHAFPSNLAPIVGQQITRNAANGGTVDARIDLLLARFDDPDNPDDPDDPDLPECDVVAKGLIGGEPRGFVYVGSSGWATDRAADGTVTDAALRANTATAGQELTFTAVPPGEGFRIGVDRDSDGFRDADELDAASDPANELSLPCTSMALFGAKDRARTRDNKGQLNLKASIVLGTYDRDTLEVIVADGGGIFLDAGLLGTELEVNNQATTYKFRSKEGPINKLSVKEDKRVPGGFKVSVRTREAWPLGSANESPATTSVILNVGGVCIGGSPTSVD
jgi:DNA-binding beta-propeller fold protein YncE